MLPPILLDNISADLLLACDREVGTDLLTQYILPASFPLALKPDQLAQAAHLSRRVLLAAIVGV